MIEISFEAIIEPPRLIVTEVAPYSIESVWLAQTEGLYIKQWWAPAEYDNVEVDVSLGEGETWRVLQRDPQGNQFSFYGRVESVDPQRSLKISITSEIYPDAVINLTQDFVTKNGGTVIASTYAFENADALNTYLALGGIERLRSASGRLDTLLSQLAGRPSA